MEQKLATATSSEVSRASSAHYNIESEIMDYVRGMTLQGKRALADKMAGHVAEAERDARRG